MTIAVHLSLFPDGRVHSRFTYAVFCYLAAQHPEDQFLFLFDQPFDASLIPWPNITGLELGPAHRNRLLKHYWFQYKLPRLLNRYRVDAVFSDDQTASLRTRVPQYLLLEDAPWLDESVNETKPASGYHRKYFPAFLQKARQVWVFTNWLKERLEERHPVAIGKTAAWHPAWPNVEVLTETDIRRFQDTHTGGKEFFLCPVTRDTANQVISVLKAFSVFKKWQQSGIRLLLLNFLEPAWQPAGFATYKYRNEVDILPASEKILRSSYEAAYAGIYLPDRPVFDPLIWESQSTRLSWILRDWPYLQSLYGAAGFYTDGSETDLAEKMMRYYKDERIGAMIRQHKSDPGSHPTLKALAATIYASICQR